MDCDKHREDLLDVLYGEAEPDAYRRAKEHLTACQDCQDEMAALKRLRRTLAAWHLPDTMKERAHLWSWPGRLVAAAAVLLLCAGGALGLSGSELRYENGRFAFRLGRGPDIQRLLAEQNARHQAALTQDGPAARPTPEDGAALLRQVEALIRASEARQAVLLGAGLADLSEQAEAQRRYDLARVSASLSYLEGRQGQQVARTSELVGYMLQAAETRR